MEPVTASSYPTPAATLGSTRLAAKDMNETPPTERLLALSGNLLDRLQEAYKRLERRTDHLMGPVPRPTPDPSAQPGSVLEDLHFRAQHAHRLVDQIFAEIVRLEQM